MEDEDLQNRLREEFDAIPVPEELEGRVRSAISSARKGGTDMKTKKHWLRNAGIALAAAAAALVLCVNVSPTAARALENIPVLGPITRVVTLRTYTDDRGGGVSAHIDVPEVESAGAELEQAIEDYTGQIIAQYESDAQAAMEGAEAGESGHYELDLSYTVVTDNERVFALRFNKTLVMASGSEEVKIYAVDKATGKLLTLADLFQPGSDYQAVLTENIQQQMRQQMEDDEMITYWLDSGVPEWDFTQLAEDAAFYIDEEGRLVIVFDEYEVAPGYMGVVEFTIPAEAVAEIALPDYLG